MNNTCDPQLASFVPVPADSHFPIQNLPLGIFRGSKQRSPHVGVAIGEFVLDLAPLESRGLLGTLPNEHGSLFEQKSLNAFMATGPAVWQQVRERVSRLLRDDEPTVRDDASLRREVLLPIADVELLMPVEIGDYTDFYSSREHATNVGTMLRGADNALMPNWLSLPVAYHGRASSVVVSGTPVIRPHGQIRPESAPAALFSPTQALDYELEMGVLLGTGNRLGQRIAMEQAADHLFGMVLVNDWSARDIQKWEYVPLGPFLSKSFATTISPWVVTFAALEPFRTAGPVQDPQPLEYLRSAGDGAFDINLAVTLEAVEEREPVTICESNFKYMYWSIEQQVAHHSVGGCNLRTGDLLASGTISGSTVESRGCLLERTWGGREPIALPSGATRKFLLDGDRVTLTGWCQGKGYRVGFGEATGQVMPAGS